MPKLSPVKTQECKYCRRAVCVAGDVQAATLHVAQCGPAREYIRATLKPAEAAKMLASLDEALEAARRPKAAPAPLRFDLAAARASQGGQG